MSFYIGKYTNSSRCHITKGDHNIDLMRGAPFSDTVFHTDVQYITHTKYDRTSVVVARYGYVADTQAQYESLCIPGYVSSFSSECIDKIAAGYAYVVVMDDGTMWLPYLVPGQWVQDWYSGDWFYAPDDPDLGWDWLEYHGIGPIWCTDPIETSWGPWLMSGGGNNPYDSLSTIPIYQYDDCPNQEGPRTKIFQEGTSDTVRSIIIFNFKFDGTYEAYPGLPSSPDISINSQIFDVGGTDISKLKMLSTAPVNNIDMKLYTPGTDQKTLQIINEILPVGESSSFSSYNNVSSLSRNGKTIISSESRLPVYSSKTTHIIQEVQGPQENIKILTLNHKTYKNGDLICGYAIGTKPGYQPVCGKIVTMTYYYPFFTVYQEGARQHIIIPIWVVVQSSTPKSTMQEYSSASLRFVNGTVEVWIDKTYGGYNILSTTNPPDGSLVMLDFL